VTLGRTISTVLDAVQGWGVQPAVNPVKLVDGRLPEVPPGPWDGVRGFVPVALATLAILALLLLIFLLAKPGGGGFIYENF